MMAERFSATYVQSQPNHLLVRLSHSPLWHSWYRPMLRSIRHLAFTGENRLNTFAFLVIVFAVAVFHWNTDPEACGSDPIASTRPAAPMLLVTSPQALPATSVRRGEIQQVLDQVEVPEIEGAVVASVAQVAPGEPTVAAETAEAEETIPSLEGAVLTGRIALKASQQQLERGKQFLANISDYSAQFKRQERIDGNLLDPQAMNLKVRHEPLSFYMKWTEGDKGRQLIYVQGQHDNKVLVQIGGVAGRLTGALPLQPDDPRIMAESRYPATCAGLMELTKIILQHHENDLKLNQGVICEVRDGESFDNRPCYQTSLVYENPEVNSHYHKSLILIDKEYALPVCVRNYTWVDGKAPVELDDHCLIEHYSYTGLQLNTQLSDNDFEKTKYRMR